MQQINVNELISHPRNTEFFDDMSGDKWKEFLESVKSRGIIEPVVVTQNKMIVSGHQRVRACKELGIESVICKVQIYDDEDQVLQDLLETNIRQRGDVGGSAKKVGLRIKELERLYGIEHGNNQNRTSNNFKSQEDIAEELNMTVQSLHNYKRLAEMIPELEELVDTGIVTKTTALAMMKNLSSEEQEELISTLDTTQKYTQKQVQSYIDEIQKLKNRQPEIKVVEREKVVDKTDYSLKESNQKLLTKIKDMETDKQLLESMNESLKRANESTTRLMNQYKTDSEEYTKVKSKMIDLGLQPDGDYNLLNAASEIAKLTSEIEEFLSNKLAPMKYRNFMIAVQNNETLKENFSNTLMFVKDWYESMMDFAGITNNNEENGIIDMEEN